jgi:uncharacterized protein
MDPLPTFRYFPDPVGEGSIKRAEKTCECCGRARGWMVTQSMHCSTSDVHPCPWCVADGSAVEKWGGCFNVIDVRAVPDAVRDEVGCRTPGFLTWQEVDWRFCCNDACVYLGEANYEDLTVKWPEAGAALLAEMTLGMRGQETDDEILRRFTHNDPVAYAFRCRHCSKFKVAWDCS